MRHTCNRHTAHISQQELAQATGQEGRTGRVAHTRVMSCHRSVRLLPRRVEALMDRAGRTGNVDRGETGQSKCALRWKIHHRRGLPQADWTSPRGCGHGRPEGKGRGEGDRDEGEDRMDQAI